MKTKEDIAKYKKEWCARNRDRCAQYSRAWRVKNPEYIKGWNARNPERLRQYNKTWCVTHSDRARTRRKKWGEANPDKKLAHRKVRDALKNGLLIRLPCLKCGNVVSEAHHEDYSKPLDVLWLCKTHHEAHHTEGHK